jgi:hypothetical protein
VGRSTRIVIGGLQLLRRESFSALMTLPSEAVFMFILNHQPNNERVIEAIHAVLSSIKRSLD